MLPGVGVAGSGPLARFLVPLLQQKGFPVVAVWGTNSVDVESIAQDFGITFSTDSIDKLLLKREVQLVVVACPPHLHAAIVTKSFSVGKHVLCDWNTAITADEMQDMADRAAYYPALISVICHPLRFIQSCQQMRSLIMSEDSLLGQVHLIEANISGDQLEKLANLYSITCDHFTGGGILPAVGSHVIDIISFISNSRAKRVHGLLRKFKSDPTESAVLRSTASDYCSFQMELEPRSLCAPQRKPLLLATVTINSQIPNTYRHDIKVHGSNGTLILRGDKLFGRSYQRDSGGGEEEIDLITRDVRIDPTSKCDVMFPAPYGDGLINLISSLSRAFREDVNESNGRIVTSDTMDVTTNGNDSSYSSASSSLNSADISNKTDSEKMSQWFKEAVSLAANFEDGLYIQAVIEALKQSNEKKEWVRIRYNTPFSFMSPSKSKHHAVNGSRR